MRRLLVMGLAGLALAGGAAADDIRVPLTVRPGTLTLAPTTLVSRAARATLTVVDARGSGVGWKLLARIAGLGGRSVVIEGVDVRCGPRSTCAPPRSRVRYPVLLGRQPAVVLDASHGTGMGSIAVTLRLASVPSPGTQMAFTVRAG